MPVAAIAAVIVLVSGCDRRSPSSDAATAAPAAVAFVPSAASRTPAQGPAAAMSTYWAGQKLIRSADLRIQVHDVPAALAAADSIARGANALVADSHTTQHADGKRTAEVVLRVPSEQFPVLLRALHGVGSIQSESVGAQDVTKEYADLDTRLAVKEQTVTRLRALLDNRTAKLSDVLDVERELGRAVAELEQMKGERRYYDQQIALSTVRLTLFERLPSQVTQFSKPIASALESATQVLGNSIGTIVYLVVAAVPWLVVTLLVVWLVPALRRRFFTRRSPVPPREQ